MKTVIPDEILGSPRMFGIETEFFVIDHQGKIVNRAKEIIDSLKPKLTESEVTKEVGQAMLEHITFPHTSARASFGNFFEDFETVLHEMETKDLGLFCYGTYPGKNDGLPREDRRYKVKENILGKRQFPIATRCIGFHYHSSLPRKSFNEVIKFFFPDIAEDTQVRVINLFNLYVAIDPAVTVLMQSSPYYEGKLYGKDSRAILYRGDPMYGSMTSLYEKHPDFGVLNQYVSDFKQLTTKIKNRTSVWKELLRSQGADLNEFAKKDSAASVLDSSWKPIKISPHGTIEHRGADMNSFSRILGLSTGLKYASKHIQGSSVRVVHSEVGNREPFKEEEGILYIPTYEKVKYLEKASALHGLDDREVYKYAKRFVDFLERNIPKDQHSMLEVFRKSLDEKKTVSDEIIDFVKKRQGDFSHIEQETAQDYALGAFDRMYRDLSKTKRVCQHKSIIPQIEIIWPEFP
jgi:hypothetical protein